MSARAYLAWPEVILSGYDDPEYNQPINAQAEPQFDDTNWANWRSLLDEPEYEEAIRATGCDALLAYTTEGLPYQDIRWVSPAEMIGAANRLIGLIRQADERIKPVVAEYEDHVGRNKPVADQPIDDLSVVKRKARWAETLVKPQIAFDLLF
jgi:hypothetical protein